jgi:hypothetical protein
MWQWGRQLLHVYGVERKSHVLFQGTVTAFTRERGKSREPSIRVVATPEEIPSKSYPIATDEGEYCTHCISLIWLVITSISS